MAETLFFYDLETSGLNSRKDRIMQFGGQRTDMSLNPIGEPVNTLIKMTPDTLPSPLAIRVTGITPQKTIQEGITEAEFVKYFLKEIALPDTIFLGFNSIRFDDEFMRFLLYRNYADSYEWQWKNGCSRWDLLDVARMTRALRPEGIKWPTNSEGKPGNKLEMLTEANNISHTGSHDALADVRATIDLARLLKEKQPKLFDYLLSIRDKKSVQKVLRENKLFVYTSGKYDDGFEKTTIAGTLGDHPSKKGILVFDLRYDPESFASMSPEELAEAWQYNPDLEIDRLPVKTLQFNRCPAIAPLGVLNADTKKRLQLDVEPATENYKKLKTLLPDFTNKLHEALKLLDAKRDTKRNDTFSYADEGLYDGFFDDSDRQLMSKLRVANKDDIGSFAANFKDKRLNDILPLYKARNFNQQLNEEERKVWEFYQKSRLQEQLPYFTEQLEQIKNDNPTKNDQFILEELRLYAESVLPFEASED